MSRIRDGDKEAPALIANSADKRVVVFIKDRNGAEDTYEAAFTAAGFDCTFIPAIAFQYKNLLTLTEHINTAAQHYSGIVATSPRGVQSLIAALAHVSETALSALRSVPLFVVGDGSANIVTASAYAANIDVVAVGGSASALGEYIKRRLLIDAAVKPLLVISGNLRRDDIFGAVKPIDTIEVETYETVDHPDLCSALASFLSSPILSSVAQRWIALFSPSAVTSIQTQCNNLSQINQWNLAAIGRTTAAAIASAGWKCAAVAATPSPTAMLQAIQQFNRMEKE